MPEWLDKVITAGPAAIFAAMWWLERSDRIRKDAKLEGLAERTITLMTELKGLLTARAGRA